MQKTKFEWDESLAMAYGAYVRICFAGGVWCDCIECFERRYNIAKQYVVHKEGDHDYHLKVLILMEF